MKIFTQGDVLLNANREIRTIRSVGELPVDISCGVMKRNRRTSSPLFDRRYSIKQSVCSRHINPYRFLPWFAILIEIDNQASFSQTRLRDLPIFIQYVDLQMSPGQRGILTGLNNKTGATM